MKINFPTLLISSASLLSVLLYFTASPLFNPSVTIGGVAFLVIVSLSTYHFAASSINDPNPNKFVRVVMAMTMIKFFVCVLGAGAMIFFLRKNLNKPDLYLLMGVYLVYSIIESIFLSQLARKKNEN